MRICGIDPGLRNTGWGIIAIRGNRLVHIADGVITPDAADDDATRLGYIYSELGLQLRRHKPVRGAIEEVFLARNAASAIKLGMARGVAMNALHDYGLDVDEISARRIKQDITGSGRADKSQVQKMVGRLLGGITPGNPDSADALAVAVAASHEGFNGGGVANDDGGDRSGGGLATAIANALEKEKAG